MPKTFWGIDIGYSSIKAVKAEEIGGKITLTDCMVVPIAPQSEDSDPGVGSIESAKSALKILVEDKALEGVPVGISISGRNVFSRYFNLPPVDNVQELIPLEAKMQIPFPLEEVIWDYHVFGVNQETFETDVAIFAVKKDIIDNIFNVARELKMNVTVIQSSAFSVLNFGVLEYGLERPLVMLEGGSKNIDLVICDQANFWPRSLPINGTHFTKALQSKFQIPYDEAEKLKINLKESGQADRIFKVLEPSMKELLGEFQRSIGFYRSSRKELNIDKIYLTGNALRIPGLDGYIGTGMSKEAHYIDKPTNVGVAEGDAEAILSSEYGSFAIAIGIATQGLDLGFVKVNFVPKEILLQQKLKKKKIFVIATLAIIALTVIFGYMDAKDRKDRFTDLRKYTNRFIDPINEKVSKYQAFNSELVNLKKQLEDTSKYQQTNGFHFQILDQLLTGSIGELERNIWFSKIKTSWEDRNEAISVSKVNRSELDPLITNSQNRILKLKLEGFSQNLEDKGAEILIQYNKQLENYSFDGRKVILGKVQIPSATKLAPDKQITVHPKLFIKKEELDPKDVLGMERYEDATKRIGALKDVVTSFYKFEIVFYVDFNMLKLPKPVVADKDAQKGNQKEESH